MKTLQELDWKALGAQLRESTLDALGELIPPDAAYQFLLDNPECFSEDQWPDMPALYGDNQPPAAFFNAYFHHQEANRG